MDLRIVRVAHNYSVVTMMVYWKKIERSNIKSDIIILLTTKGVYESNALPAASNLWVK